jgi:hypothetical protein
MDIDQVDVLISGGQGTYKNGGYYSEHPDRELSLGYVMNVPKLVEDFRYDVVIPSGGYTQKETPTLSEAESFLYIWDETMTRPVCPVVLDKIALDSAENVIFGLMAWRLKEPGARLGRIGFYSQWLFKKPRMTYLAADLGISSRFFFHGYADADQANASEAARAGELRQLESMRAQGDFLLRGKEWAEKRAKRYQHPTIAFAERDEKLRKAFPAVFAALDQLALTTVEEIRSESPVMDAHEAIQIVRQRKLRDLQAAFWSEVIQERQAVSLIASKLEPAQQSNPADAPSGRGRSGFSRSSKNARLNLAV